MTSDNYKSKKRTFPSNWVITIDDVIIPQSEYEWTDDGNFIFKSTLLELVTKYCSIHKQYKPIDTVKVCMKMEWSVEIGND